jgi:hypothetical protein
MNSLVKAAISGGAGVFVAEKLAPYVEKLAKPEDDFAKMAVKAGTAAVSTAAVYYAIGMVSK